MASEIARELFRARRLIMRLSNHDFLDSFPEEYLEAILTAINTIALKALVANPLPEETEPEAEEGLAWRSLQRIVALTSAETRQSKIYCGDRDTFPIVWCEASCRLGVEPDLFVYEGDRREISLGELYGPFPCEHEEGDQRCRAEAFSIFVTREELAGVPYTSGPALILAVTGENTRGSALCDKHAPRLKTEAIVSR